MKELRLNCQNCGKTGAARAFVHPIARGFHLLVRCEEGHWALKNKHGGERPIANAAEREKIEDWMRRNGARWDDIPRYVMDGAIDEQCQVCGECAPLERHHLAPCAVFGWEEAESWPTIDVCGACHERWHVMMVGYQWSKPVDAKPDERARSESLHEAIQAARRRGGAA